jgi:hypothetical protein
VIVGPILGQTTPHFPLYLASAVVVELIALRVSADKPLRFGLIAGLGIGTVGLASEWAWSQAMMPIPWPDELLPEGAVLGFAMAIPAALLGAWMGARLASDRLPRTRPLRLAAIGAAVAVAGLVFYGLQKPADEGIRGTIAIADSGATGEREGVVTVALDPPTAAQDADWFQAISWQGGGLVLEDMEPTGEPGTYRTSEPVPLNDDWKTLVRLHEGNSLTGLPVYLPADEAIPVDEVPAETGATREFIADHEILQREQLTAAPGLWAGAYGLVLAITLSFLGLIAWGLHRLAVTAQGETPTGPERREKATAGRPLGGPVGASS